MKNKYFGLIVIFLGIFLLGFLSADILGTSGDSFSRSLVGSQQPVPIQNVFGTLGSGDFFTLDRNKCQAGQDFILTINPLGCIPAVVRSDLLEKQNVPVFCPVTAIQTNPLSRIDTIDSIYFSGNLPKEISGVGYYPARAAVSKLGFLGGSTETNSPVTNNLGYAVIVLNQQLNESSMPDFVSGNLTARIHYDVKNAFGLGQADFYLPIMTDDEWNFMYKKYSFWQARGYLRADDINSLGSDGSATISIYSDIETGGFSPTTKGKAISVPIKMGETSRDIYIPGFDFCYGSIQLRLNGLENPDTVARLNVNGDSLELKSGQKFLNDHCYVSNIKATTNSVSVSCTGDQSTTSFTLSITPKIKISVDGDSKEFSVGDKVLSYQDTSHKDHFSYLISLGVKGDLSDAKFYSTSLDTSQLIDSQVSSAVSSGISLQQLVHDSGKSVTLGGYVGPVDSPLGSAKDNYDKSVADYRSVIDSYASEKYLPGASSDTLGQQALNKLIDLSVNVGQKKTAVGYCNEFKQKYPKAAIPNSCVDLPTLSSSSSQSGSVLIGGRIYSISFEGSIDPTYDQMGADIVVKKANGDSRVVKLAKNQIEYLDSSQKEYIQLISVSKDNNGDSVTLRTNLLNSGSNAAAPDSTVDRTLNSNSPQSFGSNYAFVLQRTNLKKVAHVSIIPKINYADTEANLSFKIGIEKRAIQLTPQQVNDTIKGLNQTITTLKSVNDVLGNAVSVGKAACLVTGTGLMVKNFFADSSGKGIAREKVMRGKGGWYDICQSKVGAGASQAQINKCLLDNSDNIEASVNKVTDIMNKQNQNFANLEKSNSVSSDKSALGDIFADKVVNTPALLNQYVDDNYKNKVTECTSGKFAGNNLDISGKPVPVSAVVETLNSKTLSLTQARDIQLNAELLCSGDDNLVAIGKNQIQADLGDVWNNEQDELKKASVQNSLPGDLKNLEVIFYTEKSSKVYPYEFHAATLGGVSVPAETIVYAGKTYVASLKKEDATGDYHIINLYNPDLTPVAPEVLKQVQPQFTFKVFDSTTYKNEYKNYQVRYFEAGEYSGLPALVPFDTTNGWYAAIKPVVPVSGAIKPYQDSGAVSSFYLCNVGKDGKEDFDNAVNYGTGDDVCEQVNRATGQPLNQFPGLQTDQASALEKRAEAAIREASSKYKQGNTRVTIAGQNMPIGGAAVGTPQVQCQDFMSPKDCSTLFNICDPVICPSSRCNLGGTYYVKDVVQSGVLGSIALCAPNSVLNGGEDVIPICLTGVHAGLDGYISVLDSYEKCLQTGLNTGQTLGICDQLHSVYMCDLFWREGLPIAQYAVPQVLSIATKQNVRGGGEYLGIQDAWNRAGQSADFFTRTYAANTVAAFQSRTLEGVGTEVCKNWLSVPGVGGGKFFDALTAPDSPSQTFATFEEIPYTTATVPATSQYKVYYHIYAGKDFPAQYQVYLKGAATDFFDLSSRRIVDAGFIKQGDKVDLTQNFIAPSGYKELCVSVNAQEQCGFKQVSTDFAVQVASDAAASSEANKTGIQTQTECVSGSTNVLSLNPAIGIDERIDPSIYNRGIIRICATDDPGKTTDPYAGTQNARWKQVGYCDNQKIKCWIDTQSVKNAIDIPQFQNISNVNNYVAQQSGFDTPEIVDTKIKAINTDKDSEVITSVNAILPNVFYNNQKGYLYLLRGNALANLAKAAFMSLSSSPEQICKQNNLKIGDQNDQNSCVTFLQNLLNTKAGETLTVDGVFGSSTESAVKRYQSSKGLSQDGIVGSNTWASLLSN